MTNRRTFLQQAGLIGAGVLLAPHFLCASDTYAKRKIGLQLYTLRNEIGKDVEGVIAKVAEAGYQTVETYGFSADKGFWGLPAADFKKLLDKHDLSTFSGHYGLDDYLRQGGSDDFLKACIEAASVSGQRYVTIPYLGEGLRTTLSDYQALAEKMNRAGELCKAADLKLAYHNHDFEFQQKEGGKGYDVLLKETDPKLVRFELDLYWVVRAKQDPVALFEQHPGRFVMWHVKDMDKKTPTLNTEVGSGSIDFPSLFTHAKQSGLEQLFIEQENFSIDPYKSIAQSAEYVKKIR
jgi:sugar phosphate isomerase/epimerase